MAADIVDLSEYGRPFQMTDYEGGGGDASPRHTAEVHQFHQALTRCPGCGSPRHKASKCPANVPRSPANDPT